MIETTLAKKSRRAPMNVDVEFSANPIPLTHSGGINEVAIATPAKLSEMRRSAMASAATHPATSAIKISNNVGVVLARISWLRIFIGDNNAIKDDVTMPKRIEIINSKSASRI